MSEQIKSGQNGQATIFKDNGRGLPTTGTKTPMPPVQPPKAPESGKKS